MEKTLALDPFARHYGLKGSDIEVSANGVAKMFFYNMLKPMFEEITHSSFTDQEASNDAANYLWHEALADSLLANDTTGLKNKIQSYINRKYNDNYKNE